jgi:hydrophobic/amphiphilic exporter-1 (mainly G- bacteria), HAE1 family
MEKIVRWCLANKSVVILATIILIVSGIYATTRLNQELLPDIEFPIITVSTPVPGAGPDVVDEQATQPIERAVEGVDGIESVQSTSSAGFSVVLVEFSLSTDTKEAEAELKSALDGVALLQQAEEPEVRAQSASEFPIMNVSLSTERGDLAQLTEYARDEAIPLIEDVDGVGSVDLVGGAERQIEVELDPARLEETGVSPDAVVGVISGAAGVNTPVGDIEIDGLSTPVRTTSELADAGALEDLPVGVAGGGTPVGAAPGVSPGEVPNGVPGGVPGGMPSGGSAAGVSPGGASGVGASEPVLLGDIAEVREVGADIAGISRTNGEPSLGLNITKETDANTVEVAEGVEGVLDEVREDVGEGQVLVVFNSAEDVEESVSGLVDKALIGGALAILIIFLFLRSVRATVVTAVSLPTSILAALLFSWADNLTLNIITLAGLTIAVGRVVDDAIVVLENAYRYVQRGYEPEEAALKGTTEVASAITSSTLTTTAVFIPLGLVGGIVSKFFLPLSLTVAFALLASLLVAVTIIPVLTSLFIKRQAVRQTVRLEGAGDGESVPEEEIFEIEGRRLRRVRNGRRRVVRLLLGVGGLLLSLLVGAVVAAWAGVLDGLPFVPGGVITVLRRAAEGVLDVFAGVDTGSPVFLAVAGALAVLVIAVSALWAVRAARRRLREGEIRGTSGGILVDLYTPALRWSLRHRLIVVILALLTFVGGLAAIPFLAVSFFPPSEERLLQATIELPAGTALERTAREIEPFENEMLGDPGVEGYQLSVGGEDNFTPDAPLRAENQAQAFIAVGDDAEVQRTLDRLDERGRELYGEGFQVQILSQGPPSGGLEVRITGGSEEELRVASEAVIRELSRNEDITNVRSDLSEVSPEVEVALDAREAAGAGLAPSQVSTSLGALLGGGVRLAVGETPVSVGVPESAVDSLGEVQTLPVGPGATVGDVAEVREAEAPSAVSRVDGDRAVTVTGTIRSEDTSSVSNQVGASLEGLDLPDGVTASVGGESEDIEESFRNLLLSIVVALALVYLILVIFFGSLVVPLIILLAVPLTTVGAFGALLITGTALSVPALLGVLLLIGIVVSNAILLVDFIISASDRHETTEGAIVEAGRARLRPILMTALATTFALLPLAFGFGGGGSALISSSLALPVIGGLVTSTFLTLLVVPVGYSLLRGRRKKRR